MKLMQSERRKILLSTGASNFPEGVMKHGSLQGSLEKFSGLLCCSG